MIKSNRRGSLIVLSGPSGSGKGTILSSLVKENKNVWVSISCTSRSVRGSEQNGIDYYFLTREEFEKKIKDNGFLEYAEYNGNYYGTPKEEIEKKLENGIDVILEIEVQGALKIKKLVKEAIFIFILPPSMEELKSRLEKRGTETEEKILKRFKTAYQEINELNKYNYVVVNDEVGKAVDKINAILKAEKCRVDRIEEVYLNNKEEKLHESLMDKEFVNKDIEL